MILKNYSVLVRAGKCGPDGCVWFSALLVGVVGMGQPYGIVTYVPVPVGRISGTCVLPAGHVSHLFLKISSIEVSAVSVNNLLQFFTDVYI